MRRGFLIDMDGVIYRGNQLIAGAQAFIEALIDLGFEPLGELPIDRIRENHALIRYEKDRTVAAIRRPIQIVGDLGDLPIRRLRVRPRRPVRQRPRCVGRRIRSSSPATPRCFTTAARW